MFNKKLIVIAVGSTLFAVLILLLAINAARTGKPKPGGPVPTQVIPTIQDEPGALRLIKTAPQSGASNIEFDTQVVLSFSRSFTDGDVTIEFLNNRLENVDYDQEQLGANLTLIPQSPLEQSMVYTVRVRDQYLRTLKEFSFLTKTLTPSPDTRPEAAITQRILRDRLEHPEIFLANNLPYESEDFKMIRTFDAGGNYVFEVTSSRWKGPILVDAVKNWLLSLELTESQIATFTIEYR